MRLQYLALCISTLILSACSTVAVQPHSNTQTTVNEQQEIAQRATHALNSVYQQPSFNFSGRVDSNLDIQHKNAGSQSKTITTEQQKIIENYLRLNAIHLSEQDKKQLFHLVTSNQNIRAIFNNAREQTILYFLSTIAKYTEANYQGGLDYRKKLFNLELSAKYHSANTLVHHRYPVLFDFNQSRIYLNHFDPNTLTGKAKQHYQAYYWDFSKHKDTTLKSVDWKNVLNFLKASNSTYFDTLIGKERIEHLTPNDIEQKQGAVEKIRLHTSVEELLIKNMIFDIVNHQYEENLIDIKKVAKAFIESEQNHKVKNHEEISQGEKAIALHDLIIEHYSNIKPDTTSAKDTIDVAEMDTTIVDSKRETEETSHDEVKSEPSEQECRTLIHKKAAFGRLTECRYEYGASIYDKNTTETQNTLNDISQITKLIFTIKDEDGEIYKTFNGYNKGQLISGKDFNDIIQKHKDILQPYVENTHYPLTFDVTLDKQGRLLHNNIVIPLNIEFGNAKVQGTVNFNSQMSNYGNAKIETFDIATQAKPITQHPVFADAFNQNSKDYDDSAENLAKKLITQNYQQHKSYEKAYIIGFITLFSNSYPEMLESVSAQDLQEIAKVYAYSYADESLYQPSIEQVKALQALEKKHQLHSSDQMFNSLGADVASLVEDTIKNQTISSEDIALVKKLKTPEAIFAHIYQQKFIEEEYGKDKPNAKQQKLLKEMAEILAQAYRASQNNTLTLDTIKALTLEHEDLFNTNIYLDSVLETEKLLKFVKK